LEISVAESTTEMGRLGAEVQSIPFSTAC